MSTVLPIQESARELIFEATNALQTHFAEMTAAWRQRMFEEFQFEGRAMVALERLNLGVGFMLFSHSDFSQFTDNLYYYGQRLAKLRVDTREVARSLEIYQKIAAPFVAQAFGNRQFQVMAALETLASASFVTVSGAYFDVQQSASDALLKVLDAELSANQPDCLAGARSGGDRRNLRCQRRRSSAGRSREQQTARAQLQPVCLRSLARTILPLLRGRVSPDTSSRPASLTCFPT